MAWPRAAWLLSPRARWYQHRGSTVRSGGCDTRPVRIAFLGFGLIGGSIARRLAMVRGSGSDGVTDLVAWSPTGVGPMEAVRDGVLDRAAPTPEAAIDGADLIVLAAPATACLAWLDDLAGPLRGLLAPGATITDVASTKAALVARAMALGLPFVGGHPMAGRETTGYAAATPDLFLERPWVIVPGGDDSAPTRVEWLATSCGARPIRMSAAAHDAAVAGVSHLPLLTAAALVDAVAGTRDDWPAARLLAATGWRDMTRLARGDVAMGTAIVATNAGPLATRVRDLIAALGAWADELERPGGPDPDVVGARLAAAKAVLEAGDA